MLPVSAVGKPGAVWRRAPQPKLGQNTCLDAPPDYHYAAPVSDELKKSGFRRIILVACVGVILGFAFVIVKGPWLVSLFFKPLTASLSCAPTVEQALQQFEELQLICAVLGGVSALVVLFFWRRFFRLRAEARQNPS